MHLLAISAQEDLAKGLKSLPLDKTAFRAFAPEGFQLEFAENAADALTLAKESVELLRPVDIAISDGENAVGAAEALHAFAPNAEIMLVMPQESKTEPLLGAGAAAVLKRPFLAGELECLVKTLASLRGAKREFDGLFNSSNSLLTVVSPSGAVCAWNAAAAAMTGVAPDKASGSSLWELLPFLKGHEASLLRAQENAEPERLSRLLLESPGAEDKYYDVSFLPLPSARGAVVKIDDISNEVKKDEHLRQAQKMDSVGSLAAGLAHDFNNVIGGIEATISTIRYTVDSTPDSQKLQEALANDFDLVDESLKRGKDIVAQLMALSRRKEQPFAQTDLNKTLSDVAAICRNAFPNCVKLEFSLWPEGAAMAMAFPTQLSQAFLNLCINACHAMTIMREEGAPQGGTLSASVSQVEVGENIVSVVPEASVGTYWLVTVSDTGVGMTRETIRRIFEPFFTTKAKGKGTGLGLAMVYNIVRQHKGFIDIYSEPGAGSSFLVFLPVFNQSQAQPSKQL